jgi:DNA-binding NtrC family response regulator
MQNHIQKISAFVDSLPDSGKYTDKINDIPEVWKRSFLIVEDFEPIRIMLKTLLENEGKVDMVENGNDALKKIAESYYDIVISDIEMPLMNGIEFCKEASKIDPDIIKRIIFCSSAHKDEYMKYITENSIRFLRKPMNITDIRRHVRELISEKSQ